MNNAIGGYFGLELGKSTDSNPHTSAYAVNSGRNALYCILETLKPAKLLIPRLFCEAILEPIQKLNIPFDFYSISESFRPEIDFLEIGTFLLYINYFGVCDTVVTKLIVQYPNQLIIDNSQAFFSTPHQGIPTFYSARKFLGVPDGAYFYGVDYDLSQLSQDISWDRCSHLLKRIDLSPEEGYQDFMRNEKCISSVLPARMSKLTTVILSSIDYESVKQARMENYIYFHSVFKQSNMFANYLPEQTPSISYPYLIENGHELRKLLIKDRVYTPIFWPMNAKYLIKDSFEDFCSSNILHFPIDHRYSATHYLFVNKVHRFHSDCSF